MLSRRAASGRGLAGLLLSGGLALAGAGTATAAPAAQAPAALAGCTTTSGVTVVVDLSHWGRGITTACAAGAPSTGLAALRAVGVSVTGTQRYGTAFVCRLAGLPTAKEDACVDTPPASAYWAYVHASGGAWVSSTLGASSYRPPVGSIEGWAFGSGAAPAVSPGSLAPPPATAPPTVPPTTAPPTVPATTPPATTAPAPTRATTGASTAGVPTAGSSRTPAPTGTPAPNSTPAPDSTGPAAPGTPTSPAAADASAGAAVSPSGGGSGSPSTRPLVAEPAASTSDGSPLPTLVALGAVLALGGAGAVAARRRRRT